MTWHKEKRANAYGFPLEAVSRAGEAGDDAGSGSPSAAEASQATDQQQLDTVAAMDDVHVSIDTLYLSHKDLCGHTQ
jgi:hypothetical protein